MLFVVVCSCLLLVCRCVLVFGGCLLLVVRLGVVRGVILSVWPLFCVFVLLVAVHHETIMVFV